MATNPPGYINVPFTESEHKQIADLASRSPHRKMGPFVRETTLRALGLLLHGVDRERARIARRQNAERKIRKN